MAEARGPEAGPEAARTQGTDDRETRAGEEHCHAPGEEHNSHTFDSRRVPTSQADATRRSADGRRCRRRSPAAEGSWRAPEWRCRERGCSADREPAHAPTSPEWKAEVLYP